MIGKYQIQLGADQFISGMSSSDYATDGALGVSSHDINPFVTPGALAAMPGLTNTGTTDYFIASVEDITGNGNARLAVGNTGRYYTINTSGTPTNVATGSDTTNYIPGRTDIAIQSGSGGSNFLFVSHGTNIALWNGGSTLSESWWTTVAYYSGTSHPNPLTANPHPLITYNTNVWIADGSQLHNIIPGAASTSPSVCVNQNVFALDLYSTIYALGIDPATGLMMISFQTAVNQNGAISAEYFVGLYDGYSTGLRRKIPVDEIVTSFQNVGGTVYMGYGRRLGVWNGNGITFLRQLKNVSLATGGVLPYKHHICNIANVLFVVDGGYILAYGDVVAGKKGFFYIVSNLQGSIINIQALFPMGDNKIGFSSIAGSSGEFSYIDLTSQSGTNNAQFTLYFNNIYMPRPIFVRRMRVITNGIPATSHVNIIGNISTEKGIMLPIATANSSQTVAAGTTQYVFDFDFTQGKCQAIQPIINLEDATSTLVRVIIYYDIAE